MLKVVDVLVLVVELVEALEAVAVLVLFVFARTSTSKTVALLLDNPEEVVMRALEVAQLFGMLKYLVRFAPVRDPTSEVVTVCFVTVFVVVMVTVGGLYDGS